jgi:hypothetical protein
MFTLTMGRVKGWQCPKGALKLSTVFWPRILSMMGSGDLLDLGILSLLWNDAQKGEGRSLVPDPRSYVPQELAGIGPTIEDGRSSAKSQALRLTWYVIMEQVTDFECTVDQEQTF